MIVNHPRRAERSDPPAALTVPTRRDTTPADRVLSSGAVRRLLHRRRPDDRAARRGDRWLAATAGFRPAYAARPPPARSDPARTVTGTDLTRMPRAYHECTTLFTEYLP
jgi:hypothetical protein